MKKRWYNYRPILFIFAFLMFGTLFAFYFQKHKLISIVFASLLLAILLIIAVLKRKIKYLILPVISFLIAFGVYNIAIISFNKEINTIS